MATRYKILSARELKTDLIDNSDSFIASQKAVKTAVDAKMANPMTTEGDVVYGGASGAPTRLAKGTAGQVLKMNSGATAPEWGAEGGGGGDWTELANVTLASAATSLASGTITAKQALRIIINVVALSSGDQICLRFNGDTGENYAYKYSVNWNATPTSANGADRLVMTHNTGSTNIELVVDITNRQATRKAVLGSGNHCDNTTTAGDRTDFVGQWNDTAAQITSVTLLTKDGYNLDIGTRMQVYDSKS
ncbi:hypothetical protein MASR2M39_30250 [Ignavibacteriales bacterium]